MTPAFSPRRAGAGGAAARPLRVLHIYRTYFPDPPGGLQEAIRQIALSCSERGIESRIFTMSPTPEPQLVSLPEGQVVRARSWAAPASCDLGGPHSLLRFRELERWADVLHFHFPWPFGDVLRMLGRRNKPAVMTYHSDIVRQRYLGMLYRPLMRRMLDSMDAVVATSPTYARTSPVLGAMVKKGLLHSIPLGIGDYANTTPTSNDAALLERFGIDDDCAGAPVFLALGVLRYYKGLHTLIEAARDVPARIVIAGSGPEMERLKALAVQHRAERVVFAGQVSDAEKIALLRRCRALVLPSHLRSEAFGMVLVEAAMFGKPMVCCEVGSGTSFVNEHGVTGLVVPPEAPVELAAALRRLLADSESAAKMGEAARERYLRLFSGAALGKAYDDLYRKVAQTRYVAHRFTDASGAEGSC
ncbi:glycosyltransferase [Cupriavidus sp. WKF15]|uniref:glycosyltransferase n=1 Tax=Cupriavidus sp. WKF15 TaxID=3032282 RepID=UPI0023E0B687|nr:glycosyltransferase [Cupriavidus sp. WKF15]WER45188.1 glycosyltransferase [Cupriavidus sp. WKF15]